MQSVPKAVYLTMSVRLAFCCRHRGLTPGKGHKACVDILTANCQGLCNICPLCHGSISHKGDVLRNSDAVEGNHQFDVDTQSHCIIRSMFA